MKPTIKLNPDKPLGLGNYGLLPNVKTASELATWYYETYGLITLPGVRGEKKPLCPWADVDNYNKAMYLWHFTIDGKPAYYNISDVNYACLTGPSDVTVIDYDGWNKDSGTPWQYINTFSVETPRGFHVYYRIIDKQIGNSVNAEKKIDIRGVGGIAILPPSLGTNAQLYSLIDPSPIAEITYEEFLKIVPWYQEQKEFKNEPGWFSEYFSSETGEGSRNDMCAKLAGYLIGKNLTIADTVEIMYLWGQNNCVPELDIREINTVVNSVAKKHEREKINGSKEVASDFEASLKEAESDPNNPFI